MCATACLDTRALRRHGEQVSQVSAVGEVGASTCGERHEREIITHDVHLREQECSDYENRILLFSS